MLRVHTRKDVAREGHHSKHVLKRVREGRPRPVRLQETLLKHGQLRHVLFVRVELTLQLKAAPFVVVLSHGKLNPTSGNDQVLDINMKGMDVKKIKKI